MLAPPRPDRQSAFQERRNELRPLKDGIVQALAGCDFESYVSIGFGVGPNDFVVYVTVDPVHVEECRRILDRDSHVQDTRHLVDGKIVVNPQMTLRAQ